MDVRNFHQFSYFCFYYFDYRGQSIEFLKSSDLPKDKATIPSYMYVNGGENVVRDNCFHDFLFSHAFFFMTEAKSSGFVANCHRDWMAV